MKNRRALEFGGFSFGSEAGANFIGLCEACGTPVLRIGVTDNSRTLEIQDIANWNLSDLAYARKGTFDEFFG